MTAITVTHCDGRNSTDVRYPPFCARVAVCQGAVCPAPNRSICARISQRQNRLVHGHADVSESRLCILMQRSASLFVISNAVSNTWPSTGIRPLRAPDRRLGAPGRCVSHCREGAPIVRFCMERRLAVDDFAWRHRGRVWCCAAGSGRRKDQGIAATRRRGPVSASVSGFGGPGRPAGPQALSSVQMSGADPVT